MDGFEFFPYYKMMIGFLLRKTFYDLWDNMFRIVLLNLGFLISLAALVFLPALIPAQAVSIMLFLALAVWNFMYLSAVALSVKTISDYGGFGFVDFFQNLKQGWKAGIIFALIALFLFAVLRFIIPFYLEINWPWEIRILLVAVIFWAFVLSVFSFQYFFAIRSRLDTKPGKIIKKCFIIFFDNPGFSIFTMINMIAMLAMSTILAFLLPGIAGMFLFIDEALRLRLMKYDWLEANPDPETPHKKRKIPWDAILIEEREKTGTRTLRNFIFPWKY